MSSYSNYTPTTTIGRAMFNFDAFGWSNFKLAGVVKVSTSDAFSYSDYLSVNYSSFNSALYSTGTGEVTWSAPMIADLLDVLSTYSQFAKITFQFQGDYDWSSTDPTINPEDIGRLGLSDINITWINRSDDKFSGISGGSRDSQIFGYTGAAGDILLNGYYLPFSLSGNSVARQTLLHELGHSLGLSHPHSAFNYATGFATLTADFAATTTVGFSQLGFAINSGADMNKEYFTVMSYDDQLSVLPGSSYVFRTYTPMILDVIALQQAYGEGTGTSGPGNDTVYAGTAGYRTYFDTGGNDTVDLTAYSEAAYLNMGVTIEGAGHLVGVAMSLFDASNTILTGGNPANLRWLYGEFENAIGSAAGDLIVGNSLSNHIQGREGDDLITGLGGDDWIGGGDGNDVMYGADGDDTFDWDASERNGADIFYGGAGDDTYVLGSAEDSVIEYSGEGTDTIWVAFDFSLAALPFVENLSNYSDQGHRLTGNDYANRLSGNGGNDVLDGGGGLDAALYASPLANFRVTKALFGYSIIDKTGASGTDTLSHIESLVFSDKSLNLQVQAIAAAAPAADVNRLVELYVAFFNRTPDADGLSYWISARMAGQSINHIADAFYGAGIQYAGLTGFSASMTNADFVNVIYKNVLGRKDGADAGGLAFWTGKLTDGTATRGSLVSSILDSAHTFKGNPNYGYVADLLDNKIVVAKTVAIDWGVNYNTASESISNGMAIAAAVTPTDINGALTLVGVSASDIHLT